MGLIYVRTGHTYDRSSILKWFKARNSTCPKIGGITMGEIGRQNHPKRKTSIAVSVAAEGAIKMVDIFLNGKLMMSTNEKQKKAAYEINLLTKSSSFNRNPFTA